MNYKPELSDIVRNLLNSGIFYGNHIKLDPYEAGGKELEEQLRAALHESDLKTLYEECSTNT